jgi:hypothetical protein
MGKNLSNLRAERNMRISYHWRSIKNKKMQEVRGAPRTQRLAASRSEQAS